MQTHFESALAALGIDPEFAPQRFQAPHAFVNAALLGERGLRLMPSNLKKIPMLKGWPERASADPAKLAHWQKKMDPPCWSILCGRSGGVFVLDADGPQGLADLARLEAELGPLPPTWRVRSGRADAGEHVWLALPPGEDDLKNQQPLSGTRVDVRGFHGQTVVAGSQHKSGRRYEWLPGFSPDNVPLAECPEPWWNYLPKRGESAVGSARARRVGKGHVVRDRAPNSRLIGDGPGFGGFQDSIAANARDYFFRAGVEAPAEIITASLRRMIVAAPKDADRDVSRYMDGPDLSRIVERARSFVVSVKEREREGYEYE
jgi:hypothetical protein